MERENFYQLLDLPLDPPETDLRNILNALKKKQTEWSRLRNHPTKGLLARKHIGMIGEIKRVMADPALRQKEADAAKELLQKKRLEKLTVIDHHMRLLAAAGHLDDTDVAFLAKRHRVNPTLIQRRIQRNTLFQMAAVDHQIEELLRRKSISSKTIARLAKRNGITPENVTERLENIRRRNFKEIDNYLKIRTTKEYLTESELTGLAKRFTVGENEILQRINCPVRPKSKQAEEDEVKPLDHTIEGVINENLKIVGKSSLYDFLGVWTGAGLDELREKARTKEIAIRKAGHKDALVTASGILAGHCISIFKTAENRNAYDLSRARARLKELDGDTQVVCHKGRLRQSHLDILVKRAVGFGVNPDEAEAHVHEYCKKNSWSVEPRRRQWTPAAKKRLAIVALVLLVISWSVTGYILYTHHRRATYRDMTMRVSALPQPEKKLAELEAYIANNGQNRYTERAAQQADKLRAVIVEKEYHEALASAQTMEAEQRWQEASEIYSVFLQRHAESARATHIEQQLLGLPKRKEQHAFKQLNNTPAQDSVRRAIVLAGFLERYPKGQHAAKVRQELKGLRSAYEAVLAHNLAQCETKRDWQACVQHSEKYLSVYRQTSGAPALRRRLETYRQRLSEERTLVNLQLQAGAKGQEYEAAKQIYQDYLEAHPNSTIREEIQVELDKLEKMARHELLAASASRFRQKAANVIQDIQTGLMWNLEDPPDREHICVDYEYALGWTARLSTGGYKDWRLPRPAELAGIYQGRVIFPIQKSYWYWTAKQFRRYAEGWATMVTVVSDAPDQKGTLAELDSRECAAVLAVRP